MLACTRSPTTAADPRRALFCRQPFCRDLQGLLPSSSYDDGAEDDLAASVASAPAPATPPSFRGGACASWNYGSSTLTPPRFHQGCHLPPSMPLDVTFHRPTSFPAETVNKRSYTKHGESPWTKRRRLYG
jgi:hypothetical protein